MRVSLLGHAVKPCGAASLCAVYGLIKVAYITLGSYKDASEVQHGSNRKIPLGRKTDSIRVRIQTDFGRYGIPVTSEILVRYEKDLMPAIREIGFPVVLKACSPDISHKTEETSCVRTSEPKTRR